MQTQRMIHAKMTIPNDSLELIVELVKKLGGKVESDFISESKSKPMPEVERGGKMLKALRYRAGLTQNEIAEHLGVPQSHISEFERDKRGIPYKHAQKLAALMRTFPSHFMRPNEDTQAAMAELGDGKGRSFASTEELFKDLGI